MLAVSLAVVDEDEWHRTCRDLKTPPMMHVYDEGSVFTIAEMGMILAILNTSMTHKRLVSSFDLTIIRTLK